MLRQHGLYWLASETVADANLLCRQMLASLPANAVVTLVGAGEEPAELARGIPDEAGPGELAWYALDSGEAAPALARLTVDLDRAGAADRRLLVLRLPAGCWEAHGFEQLARWCRTMRAWLRKRSSSLLVVSDGMAASLSEQLLPLHEQVSGLAQLYRSEGGIRYLVHFWLNDMGVSATQAFELHSVDGQGLCVREHVTPAATDAVGDDQRLFLAHRPVLEGAATVPKYWTLFESLDALRERALRAHAATVLLAIDSNEQVGEVADLLYALRKHCGNALKLVVREISPSLRYQDEQILLASGASLIVPFGTNRSRFLTLLESVQGQVWRRSLDISKATVLKRLQPPRVRGELGPRAFAEAVRGMVQGAEGGEIAHQLLRLRPVAGLSASQALGQSRIRRYGDVSCVVAGDVYLFLFACRVDGIEHALDNIFRLSWQQMFIGYESLVRLDCLDGDGFQHDTPVAVHDEPGSSFRQERCAPLHPRRQSLAELGALR